MKNIYSACDTQQSNQVRASTLIEYIKPYLQEDSEALDKLRLSLDPENENIFLTSEKFYELLGDWAKQIAATSEDEEQFNRTPNHLEVMDEKLLPFIQSTPRASFGDKLLRSEAIINLSNVPPEAGSFNVSGVEEKSSVVSDKVKILEENIKYLEHQLNKVTSDADMMRAQLLEKDEQHENLQVQLERHKTRLNGEKQMNEHLQKTREEYEELKDEMSAAKKEINSLNKKLLQYEREFQSKDADLQRIENENADLVKRCKKLTNSERELMEEIIDLREELTERNNKLSEMYNIRNEMDRALQERNNTIEEMTSEYEILNYKRNSLEKVISSSRRYSAPPFSLLTESVAFNVQAAATSTTIPIYSPNNSFTIHEAHQFSPSATAKLNLMSTPKKMSLNKSFDITVKNDDKYKASSSLVLCGNKSINVSHEYVSEEEIALANCLAEMQKNNHTTLQSELLQASKQLNNVMSDDTEIIREYQNEINVLQHEKESLLNRMDKIIEENNALADKVSNLETDIQKKDSMTTQLKIEQENKIAELEKQIKAHVIDDNKFNFEMAYKKVQIELTKTKMELEQVTQNAEDFKMTLCKLNKINSIIEKQLLLAQQELKELKSDEIKNIQSEEKQTNYEEYLLKLEQDIRGKDEEISKLKCYLNKDIQIKNTMFKDNKQLQAEIDRIQNEKMSLLDELEKAKDKCKKKYEELTDLSVKCEELKNKNSVHQTEIQKLEEKLSTVDKLHNDEIEKNTKLLNEMSTLKVGLNDLLKDYQQIVAEDGVRSEKIEELKMELESKSFVYNQLQSDFDKEITKNIELSHEITLLEQKIAHITNEKNQNEAAALKNINGLRTEAQSLMSNLKLINEKYDKEVANNAELYEQMRKLENDIDSILNSKKILEKERDQKIEKIHKLTVQVQQLTDNLNTVSHNHDQLYELYEKEIQTVNRNHSANINELKNQIDILSSNYQTVNKALVLEVAKCEQLQQQIHKMNEIIAAAASQNEKKLQEKNDEIKKLDQLKIQFENELQIKVAENRQLLQQIDRQKDEMNESNAMFKECIKHLETEMEHLKMENVRLKSINNNNNTSTIVKRKSFGKQEVSMDRLRSKVENLEERIVHETAKFEALKMEKEQIEISLHKQINDAQNRINFLEQQQQNEMENVVESKNDESLQHIKDMLEKNQQCSFELEKKIIYLKNEINSSNNILQKFKDIITNEVNDMVNRCNDELRRAFTFSKNIKISMDEESILLPEMMECNGTDIWSFIDCLKDNIITISLFMENLSKKIPFLLTKNSDMRNVKQSSPLQLKTTTIKCSRPISPDSPSMEMDSCDHYEWSRTHSDSFPVASTFLVGSDTRSELLMEIPMMDVDLSFREVFPHLTEDFLHQLGLGNDSPKKILSEEETEHLFTSFAINIAIDSINIEDRFNRQLTLCQEQHNDCFILIKNIFLSLQEPSGDVGQGDSFYPPFSLLQDLRSLLPEIVRSSLLLGMLNCEKRMLKSWNLVTNYMAILKKRSDQLAVGKEEEGVDVDCGQHIEENQKVEDKSDGNCAPSNSNRSCRSTMKWFLFTAVLVTALVVSLHFNCKTSSQHLTCPLDDFIKKVEMGEPPY